MLRIRSESFEEAVLGAVVDGEEEADGGDLMEEPRAALSVEAVFVVDGVDEGCEGDDGLLDLPVLGEDGVKGVGVVEGGGGLGEEALLFVADVRGELSLEERHEVADLIDGDAGVDRVRHEQLEDQVELFEQSGEGGVLVSVAKVVVEGGGKHGEAPGRFAAALGEGDTRSGVARDMTAHGRTKA